jgi:type IV secretion system protein TrbL
MEPGILTQTLTNFQTAFSSGWSNLQPAINYLIGIFLVIEIVMIGLWMALGGGDQLVSVMKKLLYLGFWLWIVREFPTLAEAFVQSLIKAGQIAGGGGGGSVFDPSNILRYGLNTTDPMIKEIMSMGITEIVNGIVLSISYVMIMLSYILIAWQIFYAVLEFYLITALVGIFLPFGFLEQTKFLAEKAIGAVIASGIKLMVLAFIMAVIEPVLSTLTFTGNMSWTEIWSALLTVGAIAFLTWNAPGVAAGMMAGSPSLTAGTAVQNAVVGATGAALMAGGMVAATRSAVKSIGGGAAALMGKGRGSSGSGSGMSSGGGKTPGGSGNGGAGNVPGSPTGGNPEMKNDHAPASGEKGIPESGDKQGGDKTGKSRAPNWAKQALHALHTPEEARPSGGSVTPRL